MNKFEKAQATQHEEYEKLRLRCEKLEADNASVDEMFGIKHPGYRVQVLQTFKEKAEKAQLFEEQVLEAAQTNNTANALSKITSAFSNEPEPPSEAELAHAAAEEAKYQRKVGKARTFDIFESITFAISNWSNDGLVAPDLELALKSVILPSAIARVMQGNEEYVLEHIPEKALELVREGRELVQATREEFDVQVTNQKNWDKIAPRFQAWATERLLPVLYGDKDEAWLTDQPMTFDQMTIWKSQPASRVKEFPVISGAVDLKQEITSQELGDIGLREFSKGELESRIDLQLPITR